MHQCRYTWRCRCIFVLEYGGLHEYRRQKLTVLGKIKSFFKLPKAKAEQPKPATKAAEKKLPEAPKK